MSRCFRCADLLLPESGFDKWSVIACDQHTSDIAYWQTIRNEIGDAPSSLKLILPEAELHLLSDELIGGVCQNMHKYLDDGTLCTYPDSFVYIERVLQSGAVRQGIVGVIDLERYDVDPNESTLVFATEGTVPERLPPRIRIRQDAPMELSHCVVFCDDQEGMLIESVAEKKTKMKKLYGLELMRDGGRIDGWLMDEEVARDFEAAVDRYEQDHIYLVGDGNHSLLTAKRCYEHLKAAQPHLDWTKAPARFAMVELENIHADAMCFEPIYRVVTETDVDGLKDMFMRNAVADGTPVTLIFGEHCVEISLLVGENQLIVGVVQDIIDQWLAKNPGTVDYIHGKDVVLELSKQDRALGIVLPDFDKGMLFPYIQSGKITPRKTFSIGHAAEKRYYMEGRKIL